jgi:hypothetical protein
MVSRVICPLRATTRPTGSITAEMPEFVARTSQRRCSTARNTDRARWISGSVVAPNHASLVRFTSRLGRVALTSLRVNPGRTSS